MNQIMCRRLIKNLLQSSRHGGNYNLHVVDTFQNIVYLFCITYTSCCLLWTAKLIVIFFVMYPQIFHWVRIWNCCWPMENLNVIFFSRQILAMWAVRTLKLNGTLYNRIKLHIFTFWKIDCFEDDFSLMSE